MSGAGRPEQLTVDAGGLRLAVAGARWHAEITGTLVRGRGSGGGRVRHT